MVRGRKKERKEPWQPGRHIYFCWVVWILEEKFLIGFEPRKFVEGPFCLFAIASSLF